jgi:predicted nucleic acid-binding protein
MPRYVLDNFSVDVQRNAILLDTNVLVSFFLEGDQYAAQASSLVEKSGLPMLVPMCVVCEAWGLLVGKHKRFDRGIEMLSWVITPGKVTLIRDDDDLARRSKALCERYHLDYVDAMLMLLADQLSSAQCLGETIEIATADFRDFFTLIAAAGAPKYALLDLREWS